MLILNHRMPHSIQITDALNKTLKQIKEEIFMIEENCSNRKIKNLLSKRRYIKKKRKKKKQDTRQLNLLIRKEIENWLREKKVEKNQGNY